MTIDKRRLPLAHKPPKLIATSDQTEHPIGRSPQMCTSDDPAAPAATSPEIAIGAEDFELEEVTCQELIASGTQDNGVVTVGNCTFAFVCTKQWSQLAVDPVDENKRFCNVCKKPVFRCKTTEEFARRGRSGECIAIEVVENHEPKLELLGLPILR
jgi:hypothetical protein